MANTVPDPTGRHLYVGRQCDPKLLTPVGELALVDRSDLTRHAVCLGMTGSGKTGLCISLLEELALAGVPVLAVDPKGDLTNLALAFPEPLAEHFAPWIDPATADRAGTTVQALAAEVARRTAAGHAEWGVERRRELFGERVRVTVYTPGSTAGVPVNVLTALRGPGPGAVDDPEVLQEAVNGTVAALLGLVGVEADPVHDPQALVLGRIVADAWGAGEEVTLEVLVTRLVDPPFGKVGVFPVDTFFPRKERLALAMRLNGVAASPAFAAWTQGTPLDLDALLAVHGGVTPIHVFSLAHLDDAWRSFFLTTLLTGLVAWSRRQPGAGTLRALLYMDEVMGLLPPHPANPPTKQPVLTLMKQARAVGLGVVLATQNPVDLDYKALSNAGTWLVGRLQTRQDRERVLDGLAAAVGAIDRGVLDDWLERLPSRTFVWRNAGSPAPQLVHSRYALSFLRGPLTRQEIARLPRAAAPVSPSPAVARGPAVEAAPEGLAADPPPAPRGFTWAFLDPDVAFSARLADVVGEARERARSDGRVVWRPAVWARVDLRFDEGRDFLLDRTDTLLLFPLARGGKPRRTAIDPADLLDAPGGVGGLFEALPEWLDELAELDALKSRWLDDVFRTESVTLFKHSGSRLTSRAGEARDDFAARVRAALQDKADAEVARQASRLESKARTLADRVRRAEARVAEQETSLQGQRAHEALNMGETLLALFGGRRRSLSTAVSRRRHTASARQRLTTAEEELDALIEQQEALQGEADAIVAEVEGRVLAGADAIEEVPVPLERGDVALTDFTILWVPVTGPL